MAREDRGDERSGPPGIRTAFLPELLEHEALAGSAAVVIDVLRASTTIITALGAGAERVAACFDVESARRTAASLGFGMLLGGERGGVKIAGFDLGNSPAEYTPGLLKGRTLVFTTTNGTRAMASCRGAEAVYVGAFVNRAALCRRLANHRSTYLVCAGTDGHITREDVLAAGAFAELISQQAPGCHLDDQTAIALSAWRDVAGPESLRSKDGLITRLATEFRMTRGGSNLVELGLESDLPLAADLDRFDIVPQVDLTDWMIRPAG